MAHKEETMKKYVSMILAAVLSASLLAGCGGSGSSGQQPAEKAQETAAQTEEAKETKEAVQAESAAQTDAARDDAKADAAKDDVKADTAAAADTYLVYVLDAETMAPIPGARVQFCTDVMCQKGKTDENGMAEFHSEPGTYTVHFMKAPDGYADSTEEFTLDKDNREATYFLKKQ